MSQRSTFAVRRLRSGLVKRSVVVNAKGHYPCGLSNWVQMREDDCIYVDRTKAIAQLDETTIYSCLLGPQRNGKSLLASQLALWHDKAIAEKEVNIVVPCR
jgi:hypothetical protein